MKTRAKCRTNRVSLWENLMGTMEVEAFRISNRTARRLVVGSRQPDKDALILTPFQEITIPLSLERTLHFGDWCARNFVIKEEISVRRGGKRGIRVIAESTSSIWAWIRTSDVGQARWLVLDVLFWGLIIVVCAMAALVAFGSTSALCLSTGDANFPLSLQDCAAQFDGIKPVFSATWTFAAAALPSTLYFIFERQQAAILKRKFYREVLFLDPRIYTIDEAEDKYEDMVDQAYGNAGRKVTGARASGMNIVLGFSSYLPLLACTLILLLGWIATLYPDIMLKGQGNLLPMPALSPVAYGFLGSYFFAINLLFGRYVRADLTPKTYMHIVTRVLITEVVAWALSPIFGIPILSDSTQINAQRALLLGAVFLIGIFPESGIALLHDFVTKPVLPGMAFLARLRAPTLQERLPLSLLEGVNLYDRARLLEEGIESLQNLVHHSPIDLMLRTSLPTHQIVDLYDQAILYLHLGKDEGQVDTAREILQPYGIRTATDLYEVSQQVRRRGDAEMQQFFALLPSALPRADGGDNQESMHRHMSNPLSRIQLILDAIEDDDWTQHLRQWRNLNSRIVVLDDPIAISSENVSSWLPTVASSRFTLASVAGCKTQIASYTQYIQENRNDYRGYVGRARAYRYLGGFRQALVDYALADEHINNRRSVTTPTMRVGGSIDQVCDQLANAREPLRGDSTIAIMLHEMNKIADERAQANTLLERCADFFDDLTILAMLRAKIPESAALPDDNHDGKNRPLWMHQRDLDEASYVVLIARGAVYAEATADLLFLNKLRCVDNLQVLSCKETLEQALEWLVQGEKKATDHRNDVYKAYALAAMGLAKAGCAYLESLHATYSSECSVQSVNPEEGFAEADKDFETSIRLVRGNSWVYYNRALRYLWDDARTAFAKRDFDFARNRYSPALSPHRRWRVRTFQAGSDASLSSPR